MQQTGQGAGESPAL